MNKRHFEEKNGECAACLKYSVLIFVEKIYKTQHLEGSGTPVLYIGRTVLKGYTLPEWVQKSGANISCRISKCGLVMAHLICRKTQATLSK
jgi:hypothetical protein